MSLFGEGAPHPNVKMPKGPTLTRAEREEIATLRASNLSARDIAARIDRSKTVVLNYLKNPTAYGTVKRSGRKRALTKAQEEQIFQALSSGGGGGPAEGTLSAERIRQEFDLPLSTRRVQQLLSDWRRTTRKALDQQHALKEDRQEEQEHIEDETLAPPPLPSTQQEDRGHDLLTAIPPPPSLMQDDDDASLAMDPCGPTQEAQV